MTEIKENEDTEKQLNALLQAMEAVRNGNLTIKLKKERSDIYGELADSYNSMVDILNRSGSEVSRDAARKSGMKSLNEDGLLKVQEGITTLEEVQRVITLDEISEQLYLVKQCRERFRISVSIDKNVLDEIENLFDAYS